MFSASMMAGMLPGKRAPSAESFIYCMLCCRQVREPQLLECGHAYCRKCWSDHVTLEAQANLEGAVGGQQSGAEDVMCPTCFTLTPSLNVRAGYPRNHDARRHLGKVKLRDSKDEQRDLCRPCLDKKKSKKAKKMCRICDIDFCSDCGSKHNHMVDALPSNFYMSCRHHEEPLTDVCKSCQDSALCRSCKSTHSQPDTPTHDLLGLDDYLATNRANLAKDVVKLHKDIRDNETLDTRLAALWKMQETQHSRNEQDIDRHASFLIHKIQERTQQLKEQLRARHEARREAMERQKRYLQFHIRCSYHLKHLLLQVNRPGQEFLLMSNYMQMRVRCHRHSTKDMENTRAMERVLQTCHLKTKQDLTVCDIHEKEMRLPEAACARRSSGTESEQSIRPRPEEVSKLWEPGFPSPVNDSKPKGITFLQDNRMVVAFYDAKCLKICDPDKQVSAVISTKDDKFFPNDVAFDGTDKLIVSCGFDKVIKVFKIPTEHKSVQKPQVFQPKFHEPMGVAVDTQLGRIAVADLMKHTITILNMDGKKLKVFGQHGQDKQSLNCPEFVAIDKQHRVWVSDCKNHYVKAFDMDGNYLLHVGGHGSAWGQLNQPGGLAVDYYGHVVVADGGNQRVCIFSERGEFIQELLNAREHEIYWPYGVAVSSTGLLALTRRQDTLVAVYSAYMPHNQQ